MIANKSPSAIDWTIISDIPNTSILDEYMNIDSQLNKWEDVVEDNVVIDMQDEMTAAQHATLCHSFTGPWFGVQVLSTCRTSSDDQLIDNTQSLSVGLYPAF